MITKISKTEAIESKSTTVYLDTPKHLEVIQKMNVEMEKVRREYKIKDKNSQVSASNVVLTV